jgi:hypothetical protein
LFPGRQAPGSPEGGEVTATAAEPAAAERAGGLAADVLRLFVSPGVLFADLHRHNRSLGALALLLAAHTLFAALLLSTGVPDYEIQALTQKQINREAAKLQGEENSEELAKAVEALEKGAAFQKVFARVLLLVWTPLRFLVGAGVVTSLLFLAVSLGSSAKADFRLLSGVVVFASLVTIPQLALRLFLVSQTQVGRVDTSAGAFVGDPQVGAGLYLLLRRLDPFELWYWCLVGLGLWKTGQTTGRRAVFLAAALALAAALTQGCLDVGEVAEVRIELYKTE